MAFEKRADYAEAGIPEYWIANPGEQSITVLKLADEQYAEHGVFHRGELAMAAVLPGFAVAVGDLLDAR